MGCGWLEIEPFHAFLCSWLLKNGYCFLFLQNNYLGMTSGLWGKSVTPADGSLSNLFLG